MPKPELKPCPFCGSSNVHPSCFYIPIGIMDAEIRCWGCGIVVKDEAIYGESDISTEEQLLASLVERWNRRPEGGES